MPGDKYETIWNEVWAKVQTYENIDNDQVNAFFSRLVPQAFSEGFLMLTADTEFIKTWIEKNYINVIQQALEDIYKVPFNVAIEVDTSTTSFSPSPQIDENNPQAGDGINSSNQPIRSEQSSLPASLNKEETSTLTDSLVSEYSFDSFVVGLSNQLAYSMALSVAESPGNEQLNPLFIYGKSGLGKTHLLRAIQNYVSLNYPQMKTVYVDTMELVGDYTDAAIRGGGREYNHFKERYTSADIVLIDDVQGLQGKEETLNIVFQIFKHLIDHGKQVVLSADRAPKHIDIEERYQTRFNQGGTCDIQPPEIETKIGIIRNYIEECKKKGNLDFDISNEIQEYIAQNSSSNIRELKSAVTKIIFFYHSMNMTELTIETVAQILRDHFSGGAMKRLLVSDIQKAVEQYFSISHSDLVGNKRSANISHARQIAIYLSRTMIDIPFATIGKEFNRDHTTVMYAVTQISEKAKESRELNEELEIIQQMIMKQ